MKFDRVALLILFFCSTSFLFGEAAWPPKNIPGSLGVSVHFREPTADGGWSVDDKKLAECERQMDQIADIGLKIVRIDNAWRWVDKAKGEYDFAPHHRIVDALEKRGLRPLTILCFNDPRYEPALSVRSPEGREAYAKFCGRIVKEFKGRGIIWEMWNEPNLGGFWNPKADSKEYFAAIKAAMVAMREADPECIIIGPSPCTFDWAFLDSCFAQGLLDFVSAVSVHPYSDTPESQIPRYLHLRNRMGARTVPIVCSEWGFSRVFVGQGTRIRSQDEQAALLTRSVLVSQMSGVPMHILYTIRDYDDKLEWNESSFGLVTHDGKPKAAYQAVKTLVQQLSGVKFDRQMLAGSVDIFECSAEDYVAVFSDDDKSVAVVWTTAAAHMAKVQVPGEPTAMFDMKGTAMPLPKAVSDVIEIKISPEPVFIRVPKVK